MPNVTENKHFLPHGTHTHVCVPGDKNCSLFGKFGVLCFLVTSVLKRALFTLSPTNYGCEQTEAKTFTDPSSNNSSIKNVFMLFDTCFFRDRLQISLPILNELINFYSPWLLLTFIYGFLMTSRGIEVN